MISVYDNIQGVSAVADGTYDEGMLVYVCFRVIRILQTPQSGPMQSWVYLHWTKMATDCCKWRHNQLHAKVACFAGMWQ